MALIDDVWLSPAMLPALAELTGMHRTTVARWYERRRLPRVVRLLLELVWHGRLARIHDAWSGWSIDVKSGELVTPYGAAIRPGEILAIPYRLHELQARRAGGIQPATNNAQLVLVARELLANPAKLDAYRAPGTAPGSRARGQRRNHRDGDHPPVHGLSGDASES